MSEDNKTLDALVQEKIDADADFQSSLVDLSDEDINQMLNDKKSELINEEFASLTGKAKKADEIARNQEIRAKKAEAEAKKPKDEGTSKNSTYSIIDVRALTKVHDDDVERVEKFAKSEGLSIAEAMKHEDLQAILKSKEEKRKVAEATYTGGNSTQRTSSNKEILNKIEKQEELSDNDFKLGAKLLVEAMKKK